MCDREYGFFDPDGYSDEDLERICGTPLPPIQPQYAKKVRLSSGLPAARSLTTDELQRRINAAYDRKITVLGEHTSYDMPLSVRCETCKTVVWKKPRGLMKGHWLRCDCPRKIHPRKKRKGPFLF